MRHLIKTWDKFHRTIYQSVNCITPENDEIRLKFSHNHSNIFLEGCSDMQPKGPCTPRDPEQVKQQQLQYQSEHVEVKREPINEVQMETK